MGSARTTGTKVLSISGDCRKPGVYEVPFGITARELLEMAEAENPGAMLIGGPCRQMIGPDRFDGRICYDDLATGGAIIIFNRARNKLEIAEHYLDFFIEESCGHCTPCRVGLIAAEEGGPQGGRAARASRPTWTGCATCRTSSSRRAGAASGRPRPTPCWAPWRTSATFTPGLWRSASRGCCRLRPVQGGRRRRAARRPAVEIRLKARRSEMSRGHVHDRREDSQGDPGADHSEGGRGGGHLSSRGCAPTRTSIPHGSCRVCSVRVNGRIQAACVQTVAEGAVVENDTPELLEYRRNIIDMLFVEGNHFCMFCEKSGLCELQALAYRFGITAPNTRTSTRSATSTCRTPTSTSTTTAASCAAAASGSPRTWTTRTSSSSSGAGIRKRLQVNGDALAGDRPARSTDEVVAACPVGALMRKRVGYAVPVGQRPYDAAADRRRTSRPGGRSSMTAKPRIATVSLAGCFGCHMSILDIDERILQLAELVEFDRSPINDYKEFRAAAPSASSRAAAATRRTSHVLEEFRKHCDVLISLGDCAINGGIPAMRNNIPLRECLEEAYLKSPGRLQPRRTSSRTTRRSRCC